MPSVAVRSLISDSLYELSALAAGQIVDDDLGSFCVSRLNQLLDNWNATREAVYAEEFREFVFTPNQQDYTIGPSGADFTVPNSRPVAIDGANAILDNVSPAVQNGINIRDWQWWLDLNVRAVTTTYPTDLYYEPNWPNGILHFWPKPTSAYGLELVMRNTLAQITINSTINYPPGYQNAIMLTLAEDIATPLGRPLPDVTAKKAQQARARIFANNDMPRRLWTQDAGMPSTNRYQSSFNYRTGQNLTGNR